jgi:co-chaperonin GroES (HSP10)
MLKPTIGNIVVRLDPAPEIDHVGLLVPDQAKEPNDIGTVVAVSDGVRTSKGVVVPHGIDVDERVLLAVRYAGATIEHEGETLVVLPVSEVAAIVGF